MSTSTIIVIVVIAVILIAIAFTSKHHKHRIVFHEDEIAAAIDKVFEQAGVNEMNRTDFLKKFQLKLNCSRKELMVLLGKARTAGLVKVDGKKVSKPV